MPCARTALAAFAAAAGATAAQIEAVRWAASEALTNVVMHAYRAGAGQIHVSAAVAGGELWVLIGDDGCGLRARADSPGLGLGLALMAQQSDDLVIARRASGGTEVRLRFDLVAAGAVAERHERGSLARARRPASSRFSTTT